MVDVCCSIAADMCGGEWSIILQCVVLQNETYMT